MDERDISELALKCKLLKYKFKGVFAADNFPILPKNSFQVVNASPSTNIGTHWLLFCNKNDVVIFADPLGLNISFYNRVYKRVVTQYQKIIELLKNNPIQPLNSNACGLYCLYLAHCVFNKNYPKVLHITEHDLLLFVKHMQ